jgi:glycosyltransferase involved in cell wall biosynthesis
MPNAGRGSKNWQGVVPAFARWATSPGAPSKVHLVLAGNLNEQGKTIRETLAGLPPDAASRVILTGFVSEAELAYLYRHAILCASPSFYEGFGMPAAEAMAHGCPCVLSDIPVYHEVAGNAALFVPLGSVDALAAAFAQMCDSSLRATLVERSLERAKLFTWERTADSTLRALTILAGMTERAPCPRPRCV